jgi:hypothetical protein
VHIQKIIEVLEQSKLNQKNIKDRYKNTDDIEYGKKLEFEFYSLCEKL